MDVTKNADFYRWLRERNAHKQADDRPRLELPLPEYHPSDEEETSERGVCIIELL